MMNPLDLYGYWLWKLLLRISLLTASFLGTMSIAHAQSSLTGAPTNQKLQILHKPPRISDLPEPGRPFTLQVSLKNTRDTSLVLRMLLVSDDQFQDLAFRNAYLNEYDQPTYELGLVAPLAEMQYQLLLIQDDGSILPSPAYQLARSCLPNIDAVDLSSDPNMALKDRAPLLVERAAKLEKELTAYDSALRLAGELQEMVKAE